MSTENSHKQTKRGVTTTDSEVMTPTNRKKRHLTAQYKARVLEETRRNHLFFAILLAD